ncbi:MAG: hypothetical protein ABIQ75_07890 [Flavobacteriales bacterium]
MKSIKSVPLMLAIAASTLLAAPTFAKEPRSQFRIDSANFEKLNAQEQERVIQIGERWDAIANMDRSDMTKAERQELRTEVNAMKAEARTFNRNGTVIYLSTGAIIIIILLLIIIL